MEITNSSISASGDGTDVAADWEATRADNPHIKYHGNRRGYIACTVTPGQMRAEFRSLERVTQPDAPVKRRPRLSWKRASRAFRRRRLPASGSGFRLPASGFRLPGYGRVLPNRHTTETLLS